MITPIEKVNDIWVKRDDLFTIAGVRGGKVRSCWHLAQGAKGLVTAGSRQSPQVSIVAHIANHLRIPCRVHVPHGKFTPELQQAYDLGAEIIPAKPGFNSVIIGRAKKDANEREWAEIPFGMECTEAALLTSAQVIDIPKDVKRIVIPVGSGMSLAGLLIGLNAKKINIPVLGVRVGADPIKRINQYAPSNWTEKVTIVNSELDYHKYAENCKLGDIDLDPIYEAKCLPFLQPNDLFWIVGIRKK